MIKSVQRIFCLFFVGFALVLFTATGVALADGTETLAPASIPIASGTGIVANGVGLEDGQVPTFTLDVPAGATVKQVILYWSGGAIGEGNAGDNTVKVNGTDVTGTPIGGPTFFFSRSSGRYYFSTYRADITNLGIITAGSNTITVSEMDFAADENNGAGIMAIIDDGSQLADIQVRDGLDLAFINFPGLRNTTVPQTFTFAPAAIDRVATMPMFFGSVAYDPLAMPRPSSIEVRVDGNPTPFIFSDLLNSNDGPEWDTVIFQVPIPAGVTSFTVQAISRDDNGDGQDPLAASFTWLASSVVIKPEQEQVLLSLGNRVWNDNAGTGVTSNPNFNNGLLDSGENGIAGVSLQLLNGDGTAYDLNPNVGGVQPYIVTSDASGYYTFTQLIDGSYRVRVLASNFNAGGPLENFVSSNDRPTTANPNNDVDNDDNGIGAASGIVSSGVVTLAVETEPVGEIHLGQVDNSTETNYTVDFGFWQATPDIDLKKYTNGEDADVPTGPEVAYGGVVTWTYDITNTGNVTLTNVTLVDNIEGGISCPQQQLLPGEGMTCVLTGVATTLGQYANTAIVTGTPTIFPTRRVTDTDPSHYITRPFSLGNRVWLDDGAGGGAPNDGVQNGAEPGLGGVTVNLLDSSGAPVLGANQQPITTVTAGDGCYLFDNLRRGDYIVEIAAGNFNAGQPLADHISSSGNSVGGVAPSPNTDIDLDDNGNDTFVNQAIRSGVVTLELNSEPLGEALCGAGSGNALDRNSNLTVDFGFVANAPVSVGDFVWFDNNSNGLQEGGETGVSGVTVRIFTAGGQPAVDMAGNPVPAQATDATGLYLFTNLPPGSYYVVFDLGTLPAGFLVTTPNVGADDAVDSDANPASGQTAPTPFLVAGSRDLTLDMGIVQLETVRVGDFVWIDANVNGRQDAGEPGVPNVTVNLFDAANDQQLSTQQTGADGFYLFTDLPPGQYYVVFDLATLPAGYQVTTQNAAGVTDDLDSDANPTSGRSDNSRVLAAGEEDLTLDMGVFTLVSVGNLVWRDDIDEEVEEPTDNNGLVDPGEPGFANIPVRLFDISETLIATTTTDANGNYRFDGLMPGEYIVEVEVPAGYSSSTGGESGSTTGPYEPAPDPDNDIDNDDNGTALADPQVIRTLPVTLSVGDEPTGPENDDPNYNPTVDFGIFKETESQALAVIGDFVWEDANCDGVQEPNAAGGLAGITVRLFTGAGALVATTTTDADGIYLFENLDPGDYFVEFEKPADFTYSPVRQGQNIELDSDAVPVSQGSNIARTETTTLVENESDRSWDAGLCSPTNLDPGDEPSTSQSTIFLPLIQQ